MHMDEFNPFQEEEQYDPLRDSSRETGFIDHFWDWDTIQVQDSEEQIGESNQDKK